jgi:hypothetical protein
VGLARRGSGCTYVLCWCPSFRDEAGPKMLKPKLGACIETRRMCVFLSVQGWSSLSPSRQGRVLEERGRSGLLRPSGDGTGHCNLALMVAMVVTQTHLISWQDENATKPTKTKQKPCNCPHRRAAGAKAGYTSDMQRRPRCEEAADGNMREQ